MSKTFGPWSTAMNTGAKHDLNTFWKRRLAMLPALSESPSRATRRAIVVLVLLAIGALALPAFKRGSHAQTLVQVVDAAVNGAKSAEEAGGPSSATKDAKPPAMLEFLPRLTHAEDRIIASLEKPTTIEFLDLALEDCLTFLKEFHDIPVHFERSRIKEAQVALDDPVTLKVENVRLESALNLLLQPFPLDYLVEDDVLKVTSKKAAEDKLIVRTYPVGDLCRVTSPADAIDGKGGKGNQPNQEKSPQPVPRQHPYSMLMNTITSTVDPDSWEELSGPGSLQPVRDAGSLVIRQTWSVHRKILQLLRDLREAKRFGSSEPERNASERAIGAGNQSGLKSAGKGDEPSTAREP